MRQELPVLKPKQVVAALEKAGFELRRQIHPRDLPKGTLRAIIREARLTVEGFLGLL